MLTLRNIRQDIPVKYATFWQEGIFNIVSTVSSINPIVFNCTQECLILLSPEGFLIEIELLFVTPIQLSYHEVEKNKVYLGTPCFYTNFIQAKIIHKPVLFLQPNLSKAFLSFNPSILQCDSTVLHTDMEFFFYKNILIGMEIFNIISDPEGDLQSAWINRHINQV